MLSESKMNIKLQEGVIGIYRDAQPTFSYKIESFSLLAKTSIDKCESNDFEAGGYKWKIWFYPNGIKKNSTGVNCISMYLEIVETSSLPPGWEVDVSFRFFVFDQIKDKYLIFGDLGGSTRRFHEMKRYWGFDELLPLKTLNTPQCGYLVNDTCVFGVDVFVSKCTGNGDCLSMVKKPTTVNYTWKIENFSQLNKELIISEVFMAGGQRWSISVYPKGDFREKNCSCSIFIFLADWKTIKDTKVCVSYKLRVRDQFHDKHREFQATSWIGISKGGLCNFIGLAELNDQKNGFLVKDMCIVEAEITVLGIMKKNSSS